MQKFDTPAPVSAVLGIPAGRVHVVGADRTDTTVEVLPADAAKSRDVKAAERTEVAYGDGVLRIEAATAGSRLVGDSGSVAVTVHLPTGSRVEAKTAAVALRTEGRLGEVAVEGAQGQVEIEEAASARISVQDGDVVVGRLSGDAQISAGRGDIRIAEVVLGALVLHTEYGAISVDAAPGVSASLDAGTGHGRIHNSLKNTGDGEPEVTIRATTAHGDITARSL